MPLGSAMCSRIFREMRVGSGIQELAKENTINELENKARSYDDKAFLSILLLVYVLLLHF